MNNNSSLSHRKEEPENGILYMNKEPGLGLKLSSDAVNKFGKKIN